MTGPRPADRQLDLALLGEFERVGQQVLEHLLEPLKVGVDRLRAFRRDVDLEHQLLFLRDMLEHEPDVLDQAIQRHGLGPDIDMSRLDLREIENVVDEGQQIVARRLDGLGEVDLFLAQIPLGIVGQQLGEDQRGIQRRAQFMAHIGEEIRLVPARLLQLARLQAQGGGGFFQIVALHLQLLGLFLELRVGLFQLRLLLLEPYLRLLQRPALLLDLLVGDAEFLALNLQFLGLTLGFLEQVLQLGPIFRRAHGDADRLRGVLQQRQGIVTDGIDEAEFNHRVDLAVGIGR